MGIVDTFKLYEDNDPKHSVHIVKEWKLYNCPRMILTPPQSPDLNPIENLWNQLDRAVHVPSPSSVSELRRRLPEEWIKLNLDYIQKIIRNMPTRLQAILDQKGNATQY